MFIASSLHFEGLYSYSYNYVTHKIIIFTDIILHEDYSKAVYFVKLEPDNQ